MILNRNQQYDKIFKLNLIIKSFYFKVFREIKIKDFDSSQFVTKQHFYLSKDGTKVPLFAVHHKVITLI